MRGSERDQAPKSGSSIPVRVLYPVSEVAKLLGGVSDRFIWDLIAKDRLASVQLGRRRMIPAPEIDRYVAELRAEQGGAR